eukprot:sb/3462292/
MLGGGPTMTPVTSVTLYELSDSSFQNQISDGDYWAILRDMCGGADNGVVSSLESTYKKLGKAEERLVCAASAFNVFLQNNFTGPLLSPELLDATTDRELCRELSTKNNAVYPLVKCVALFLFARQSFREMESCLIVNLFRLRCVVVHQNLLDELCPKLFEELNTCVEAIEGAEEFQSLGKELQAQVLTEVSFGLLTFEQFSQSRNVIRKAMDCIGFSFKLTGALGKRTKWQEKSLAQLKVEMIVDQSILDQGPLENEPEAMAMNDDTLLEKVAFSSPDNTVSSNLTAPFLLHTAALKLRDNALEEMLREEVVAFLDAIIGGRTFNYSIATHAFFIRSKLEKTSVRRLCRSMEQLEEIVQGFDPKKTCSRTGGLFRTSLPPMWIQQKLLADLYTSVGSHKSALELFEKLELWEDQVLALIGIGRYEAAEKLTRGLIAKEATPKWYCILGDTTQDITYYETAWELSEFTSARAMKSLGYHYFNTKNYPKAMECMQKSLECNHLQGGLWFTTGCTAMAIPDYATGAKCFTASVNIDDENGQSWSNLGACHERLGNLEKAHNCYKEATRHSFNNWRIWENYICSAARIQHFASVIVSYKQILNLGHKYADPKILNCLVSAVVNNTPSIDGKPGITFFDRVLELFKFASSKVTTSHHLWKCYATLYLEVPGRENLSLGIDYLIKGYHACSLTIEKSVDNYLECGQYGEMIFKCVSKEEKDSDTYGRHLQSLSTILQILVTKGHKLVEVTDESEEKEAIREFLGECKGFLEKVEELMLYT